MSIIKQKAVASERHATNLRDYINDKDALLRDSQNLIDEEDWYQEMDDVREAAGHNQAARGGAKNVILYHQIIAFLPEEADINGGKMTPRRCIKYAKEYAQMRYPEFQIAFALHREHCKEDNTERYAVHMAINRTNLKTGKRLAEGRGEIAKIDRARTIRELDEQWGLQQVEKDKPNSKIHSRQARGAEKEITERGEKSYKRNLRRWCNRLADRSSSLPEFCSLLEAAGYQVTTTNNKVFVVDLDHKTNKQGQNIAFNLSKLDGRFSKQSLENSFAEKGTIKAVKQGLKQIKQAEIEKETLKAEYQNALRTSFADYQKTVQQFEGKQQKDILNYKPPKLPEYLQKDMQVRQLLLEYRNRASNLRSKLASDTPHATQEKAFGSSQTGAKAMPRRVFGEQSLDQPGKEK